MNELSWLIYLAGALGSVGVVAAVVMVIAIIAGVFYTMFNAIENEVFTVHKGLLITASVAAFIGVVVPDRNTIYAIAASETGEKMLATPVANKATKALEVWLDKQIKDATADDDANED